MSQTALSERIVSAFSGEWRVIRPINAGLTSSVFCLASAESDDQRVLKVFHWVLRGPDERDNFLRTLEPSASVRGKGIVPIERFGTMDELPYIIMPYVEGPTLRLRLTSGMMTLPESIGVAAELFRALDRAHSQGIRHRDVRPGNIFLTPTGAVVAEFGVSHAIARGTGTRMHWLDAGLSIGARHYLAPEELIRGIVSDERADIYAAAIVAYEMLAGCLPFEAPAPQAVVGAKLGTAPKPLASLRPGIPGWLSSLIAECLAPEATDRPARAGFVASVLLNNSRLPSDCVETICGNKNS